jgi:hypothetical protein
MRVIPIIPKNQASAIVGGLTQTSKMPCKSYSLPTIACRTGFKMAQVKGSICSECYANKGFYSMYAKTIEPAQHARLVSIDDPLWIDSMVNLIGSDEYFRWLDSGDLQSVAMLRKIALVCEATPDCEHWLPTREYGIVKQYIAKHGAIPRNLTIRLSAMFPDKPVVVPLSLRGIAGITVSNVHSKNAACNGQECEANKRGGKCGDCRACWNRDVPVVSYQLH